MSLFDDDLAAMFGDFEFVTIRFGSVQTKGNPDVWDQEIVPGAERGVVAELLAVEFPTAALPGLKVGSEVSVWTEHDAAGVPTGPPTIYGVRDRRRPADAVDGKVTHALLARVS